MIKTLTKTKRKIILSKELKRQLQSDTDAETQVTVHCSFTSTIYGEGVRVWKTTYLIPKESSQNSKLVSVIGITMYPIYTYVEQGSTIHFTLVFSGLPRGCKSFDLIEKIPVPNGFVVKNISRNNTDVYHLVLE